MRVTPALRDSGLITGALGIVLAASLALAIRVAEIAARKEHAAAFAATLPYPVIEPQWFPPTTVHLALVVLGAVQALALYFLYRALRERKTRALERAVLAACAAVMLVLALRAPVMSGFDAYAYVGYAKTQSLADAYAPPPVRLPGEFGVVNTVWGTPLVPSYYGPLWVGILQVAAGRATTLGEAIFALRLLEVVAFAAIAIGIFAWRRDGALSALLVLNPALYSLYVTNAHNDLFAVAFLLGAAALARRVPLAASAGIVAAALIKIPFVVAALYVFAGRGNVARRVGWVALTLAVTLALSLAFGGTRYFEDLAARLHQTTASSGLLNLLTARAIKLGLLAVAAIALATAFFRNAVYRAGGWSFITLGSLAYPWYLVWALPYAALERGALAAFLVPLPFAAAMMETAFPHLGLGQAAMLLMLVAAAYEMLRLEPRPIEP